MPRTAQALALLFALALAGCATQAPTSAVEEVALTREDGLSAVNAFRTRNNLKPVTISESLMQAAAFQSEAMARRDTLGHTVAGALPGRVERFGYRWSTTAENIGRNYPDYAAMMDGWITSPGHRRNLLNPNVTEVGFAARRLRGGGPIYWTQIFAAPSRRTQGVTPADASFEPRWGAPLRFP